MNTIKKERSWIGQISSEKNFINNIIEMAEWLNLIKEVSRNAQIIIKPNMTYPFYKKGVSTGKDIIEAVVKVLREISSNITIVEADGGSYAWPAEQSFEGHGLTELCRSYGIKAVNLSKQPRIVVETEVNGENIAVEIPALLLHETDYFITMPVPKVHVMTGVSLGFKNQWGCLPDVKRLRDHPNFDRKVIAIHKIIKPNLAIFDGSYFLNVSGPMDGVPVKMNLIIAGDVGATTLVCCKIMGINQFRIKHLSLAMKEGLMPESLDDIKMNLENLEGLQKEKFYLERTLINWMAVIAFHNNFLTKIIYDSIFAKPIHDILYLIRGKPKDFMPKW